MPNDTIVLPYRVAIYVPSTMGVDATLSSADAAAFSQATAKFLAAQFGGATEQSATGSWIADRDGSLVREAVTIVYSYAEALTDATVNLVFQYVELLKKVMRQERISLELGGKLLLV